MIKRDLAAAEEDKLRKERERIRIASQKTRQKRKDEERTLRTENEQMKRDRLTLVSTLQELEETVRRLQQNVADKDDALSENEMLMRELAHYKDFGSACVMIGEQFATGEQHGFKLEIMGEVAKSGGDMADLKAERIIAEALSNDKRWRRAGFDSAIPQVPICLRAKYRINDDGACEYMFSFAVPLNKGQAKLFAERYRSFWVDPRPAMTIFGSKGTWLGNISTAVVENLSTQGKSQLMRIRNGENRSWVFVMTGADEVKTARSTLMPCAADDYPLCTLEAAVAELKATSEGLSSSDSLNTDLEESVASELNRVGLVDCWSGTRATIMLDSSTATREDCVKGNFLESFRVWNDDIESSDPRMSGPGVRGLCVMSASPEFAQQVFGPAGFKVLFNEDKVAPTYQQYIDFLAMSLGMNLTPCNVALNLDK